MKGDKRSFLLEGGLEGLKVKMASQPEGGEKVMNPKEGGRKNGSYGVEEDLMRGGAFGKF